MKTFLTISLLAASLAQADPVVSGTAAPDYLAGIAAPSPTPEQVTGASLYASQLVGGSTRLANIEFQEVAGIAFRLWKNPEQAQAVVDALGEKAAPLFVFYGDMMTVLPSISPAKWALITPIPKGYGWTILPKPWLPGRRSVLITTGT